MQTTLKFLLVVRLLGRTGGHIKLILQHHTTKSKLMFVGSKDSFQNKLGEKGGNFQKFTNDAL